MRKIIITLSLLMTLPALAEKEKNDTGDVIIEMMVVSKATGMCGVFAQMVNFQQSTKMPGGDEFIVRFLKRLY